MGGRGGFSGGGGFGGGGGGGGNAISTTSMISEREGKRAEVDQALRVMRDIQDRYGVNVSDAEVAIMDARGSSTMAYYDQAGNVAINNAYFDAAKMDAAYDRCIQDGFHPSRGNKTGIEAAIAHELGHRITDVVGEKMGLGSWELDKASSTILKQAKKSLGYDKIYNVAEKISGYAKQSPAEAIAEAFSDVYCNGGKAKKESTAIVNVINTYF